MLASFRIGLAAIFLAFCGIAQAEDGAEPPAARAIPTLDDFLSDPDYWSPEMSPTGRFLAGVRRIEG